MVASTNFDGLFNPRFFNNFFPIPASNSFAIDTLPPNFELPDVTSGNQVKLANFRGKQPVILAFTRIFSEKHYCPFCFPHIKALNERYEEFRDRNIAVLMITSTDPEQSKVVARDLHLNMPLLSDPSCQTFRAYETGQALGAPLPAQFVLDEIGRLRYKHLFSFLDHNASVDTLLDVVDLLKAGVFQTT